MFTLLLTWNPNYWDWSDLEDNIGELKATGTYFGTWSTGKRQNCLVGDRVFLLRQGKEPRGIVASGYVASPVFQGEHWLHAGRDANYVDVAFDAILDGVREPPLSRSELEHGILKRTHWNTQTSGILIPEEVVPVLEERWAAHLQALGLHMVEVDEVDSALRRTALLEGASRVISSTAHERNRYARKACFELHGRSCAACGDDLVTRYGPSALSCLQVHHVVPLSSRGGEYVVDPMKDLVPVCPNCHSVMHSRTPPLSVREVQVLLNHNTPAGSSSAV